MQKIVIVANGAAYGSESLFNSLRLAIALREQEGDLDLRLFLMSDAVTAGLRGQKPAEGYNIQQMLEILTAQNVPVKLCKTCTDGRGITTLPLIDGVAVGTLVEDIVERYQDLPAVLACGILVAVLSLLATHNVVVRVLFCALAACTPKMPATFSTRLRHRL